MGQAERLSPLQMGIARNHRVAMLIRLAEESLLQPMEIGIHLIQTAAQPEPQIGPDLIVATAAGVQLLPNRAKQGNQPTFNRKVNVLIGQSWIELPLGRLTADGLQPLLQLIRFGMGDDAAGGQHAGMGDGAVQILLKQGEIETDRSVEGFDEGMQTLFKTITPGACGPSGHPTRHR